MSEGQRSKGEEEQVEGLPTAAEVHRQYPNGDVRFHSIVGGLVDEGDKLVRRADVEALIQDRLEKQEERVENLTGLDRVNLNDAKARRQELEELLDEVQ